MGRRRIRFLAGLVPLILVLILLCASSSCRAEEGIKDAQVSSDKDKSAGDLNSMQLASPGAIEGNREKRDKSQNEGLQKESKDVVVNNYSKDSTTGREGLSVEKPQPTSNKESRKDEHLAEAKDREGNTNGELGKPSMESKSDKGSNDNKDTHSMESKPEDNNEKDKLNEIIDWKTLPGSCDPSNSCIDEKNKFIACLRVPGQDSLALSVLIQNKGKGSLTVKIDVPSFVTLDQNVVQLQKEENKEVEISVKEGINDTVVLLKAGEGQCRLDLSNMIQDSNKKTEISAPRYIILFKHTSTKLTLVVAVVLLAVVWLLLRFYYKQQQKGIARYEKVEMTLPVSSGGKKDSDDTDGWDTSWGDDWDDEEAPVTPSRPVSTPSSRGLASRKLSKDSWKD